jgi:hypothetical protein
LAHWKKKLKLWRLTKIEDSMERWSASPFGRPIWAKHMGLKCGAIGNTLGEHIENSWESIGNLKFTCWEQRKNAPPNPKLKRKRIKAL